jgi:hypothetical protein
MLLAVLLQAPAVDSAALRHPNGVVPPIATAARAERAPVVDGRLDDAAWALATPVTDLTQSDPQEGQPATERTEVRFVYDGDALYIGARMFDREPRKIAHHLGRRDSFTQSDDIRILLDSYHDHRTAFRFIVTPDGVRGDLQFGDDGNFADDSWDPVWQAAARIDSLGWTAEMRIPFSQLRFSRARDQMWGFRIVRSILRKNETDIFPFVHKTDAGFVSRFAHLVGLRNLGDPRQVELLPYTLASGTYQSAIPGDPFAPASDYTGKAGLDLKYGVTSNLTVDATLNPDFGQVEIDPAFVNLSAFEQFLPEHRPFFVEGADIFNFGGASGGFLQFGNAPQFFYSRRIGRAPEGSPTSSGQYVDMPQNTTILGAAKLTGRSPSGWSVGVLDAVTRLAQATVLDTTTGNRFHDDVEPTTNYFVARVRRQFHGGNDGIGFIATASDRAIHAPALDVLRSAAYDWGVDARHRWHNNTYGIAADFGGSYVTGDTAAINAAQLSSARYYQRPDANLHYDPTRTSLSGLTGDLYIDKLAGAWLWGAAVSTTTPGFEVNDLGFQHRVDRIASGYYVARHWTKPGPVFQEATAILQLAPSWNYEGDPIQRQVFLNGFGTLRNFWFFNFFGGYGLTVVDDRLTRGGPLALIPSNFNGGAGIQTDQRHAGSGGFFFNYSHDVSGAWSLNLNPTVEYRPSSAIDVSVGPNYNVGRSTAQYVQTVADPLATATYEGRYVFADLRSHELDLTVRVNATVTPALSLQLYAQPFAFAGAYSGFKELAQPRTYQFNTYGRAAGTTIGYDSGSASYTVHPDGAQPSDSFFISNPDFRVRSLNINAVLRWEYRPGSTLFVVWTQRRSGFFNDPSFDVGRDFGRDLLLDRPTNVLLVKLSYWLRV